MNTRTLFLSAALLAGLAVSSVAQADTGRGRDGSPRAANAAFTAQQGRGNAAGIAQTGSGNTAGLVQFGQNNTGTILQAGSNNSACLIQAGRNLEGGIQQVGDNLTTGVLQNRWGTTEIPVEACSVAATRRDLAAYTPPRPEQAVLVRRYKQGRINP